MKQDKYDKLPLGRQWAYDIWYALNWFNKVTLKEITCWGKGHRWYKLGDRKVCYKCGKLVPPFRFKLEDIENMLELEGYNVVRGD